MNPTEYFIARPSSALAVALLLMLAGAAAFLGLPWRGQDRADSAAITVDIAWRGADAADVRVQIAEPAQRLLAGIDGVAAIDARSDLGQARLTLHLRPGAAPVPLRNVVEARLRGLSLPATATPPAVAVALAELPLSIAIAGAPGGADLDERVIAQLGAALLPQLQAVPGVASVEILGGGEARLAIQIDPKRAAALGVTIADVEQALAQASGLFSGGKVGGGYTATIIQAGAPVASLAQLNDLIVGRAGERPVRLSDIAQIDWRLHRGGASLLDGRPALVLMVHRLPATDGAAFSRAVRQAMPRLAGNLPAGFETLIFHDPHGLAAQELGADMTALLIAIGAMVLAIWLTLGWWRAGLVPLLSGALTLAVTALLWWAIGGAITPVTVLAMVLAMALVGDDAMAVVEDVDRQLREGKPPMLAPLFAARHLARPTVALALAIAALYVPLALAGHGDGVWLGDFALVLIVAALVSGASSLILAPALCARLLRYRVRPPILGRVVERGTRQLTTGYDKAMVALMAQRRWVLLLALAALGGTVALGATGLNQRPQTGGDLIEVRAGTPANADRAYLAAFAQRLDKEAGALPELDRRLLLIDADGGLRLRATLKPHLRSDAVAQRVVEKLQPALDGMVGVSAWAATLGGGEIASGAPLRLVLASDGDAQATILAVEKFLAQARNAGTFAYVDAEPIAYRPVLRLNADRAKAAALNFAPDTIGRTLSLVLADTVIGRFTGEGANLPVMLGMAAADGDPAGLLGQIYIRDRAGKLAPLIELVQPANTTQPVYYFQRDGRSAILVHAAPRPGIGLAEAAGHLRAALQALPGDFTVTWQGAISERGGWPLPLLIAICLLAAYLVMAAIVENFRDALAIVVAASPGLFLAAGAMALGYIDPTAWAIIGALTGFAFSLRQGVLLNKASIELQVREHRDKVQAVGLAALGRLRPSLIGALTVALVVAPLLVLGGPGAALRFALAAPLLLAVLGGTLLALLSAPAVFSFIGANHGAPRPLEPARRTASHQPRVVAVNPPGGDNGGDAPRPLRPVAPLAKPKPLARRRKAGGADDGKDGADPTAPGES